MIFNQHHLLYALIPILVITVFFRWKRRKHYYTHPLLFYIGSKIRPASSLLRLPKYLEFLAFGTLFIGVLDPVLPFSQYRLQKEGLDVILVLDLSSSMQEPINREEMLRRQWLGIPYSEKSRLDTVKDAMIRFVKQRDGDRVGVVVFSENGYVVAPMTTDIPYLTGYLTMVDNRTLSSEGQTAIGEGILTALHLAEQNLYIKKKGQGRVMVVLTDGENNTGRDPYMALEEAQRAGFKVHFIGVEVQKAHDAPRLIAAIQKSGGKYYDVKDREQLEKAYVEIDRIEKGHFITTEHVTHRPYFQPFVIASLLFLAASVLLRSIPRFMEIS